MSYFLFAFLFSYSLSLSSQLECRQQNEFNNFSAITIAPTKDSFCVGEEAAESCCSGSWESLVDSTWNSWFGQLELKFTTISGTLSQAHQSIRSLNCASSGQISNSTVNLYKETLNSIESLQVDWKRLLFNITNKECRLKLVQAAHCPTCNNLGVVGGGPLQPCRSLCTNILRGCLWQLDAIQSPWKHAISSVRTAVRLLASPQTDAECRLKDVEWFTHTLITWREPLQWLDSTCEILPDNNNECYNGKTKGVYLKQVSSWSNQKSNPEFVLYTESNKELLPIVLRERDKLTNISKTLENYWPRVDGSKGSDDPMSSDEAEGSASGNYPSDLETDDEDLLHQDYGSGTGSGEYDHPMSTEYDVDEDDGRHSVDPLGNDISDTNRSSSSPSSPSSPNTTPTKTTTKTTSTSATVKPEIRSGSQSQHLPPRQIMCHLLFFTVILIVR